MSAKQTKRQRKGIGWVQGMEATVLDWIAGEASLRRCWLCETLKEVKE